ncbi:hypothetical protein KP509_30G008100 [Ceratopteris richardii]|uniref:Uncharacterized protein n=1 Tax=Ceratopteris richardii TaxID=49495 RepID=A0A8T2R1M1_CERRI|nr:hypothetical protein KP509_30G008100 [Ceratopteris richardii]KAH7289535.1 hypothetical protein KP509_30G008100 [Ceratopteris richardii]
MQQQASHSAAVLPEETPSRYELISIVRKHSTFLKNLDTDDANKGYNNALDMRFWRELVDMFFVRGMINSKDRPDDDLVFFVHHLSPKEQTDLQPYFVRRWCSQLEKVIGDNADEVDWHRSFYLNLIAHTTYTLTVAICKREALQNRQKTVNSAIAPVYQISKTVYASPSRVNFQTNMSKGFETVPAYPDICFTIDDYDDTFEEVLTLFSGFVSYDMVRSAFEGGRSKIRGFLVAASSARSERLIMHGPGGRGEVEVSVSGLPDESVQPFSSSLWGSTHGTRIGSIVRKAAITALLAAKQPYVHSSSVRNDVGSLPLRCCLMSLSLPWDALAHDLLFKDLPNDS